MSILFSAAILGLSIAHARLGIGGICGFWLVCVLIRPLGASFGDLLALPSGERPLGFGTSVTSAALLAVILLTFAAMSVAARRAGRQIGPAPR